MPKKKAAAAPAQKKLPTAKRILAERKKAAQPSRKTPAKPPARPVPRKGKARTVLPKFDPLAPVLSVPAEPPAIPKQAEPLPESLPIFLRWTVEEHISPKEKADKVKHSSTLCFDGTLVYTLEGPDAGAKLQHQADQWNAQEYIPKLDVHPGYFRARPGRDAFLQWGKGGDKPFAT